MEVIPAVNEENFEAVADKIKRAAEFLPAGGWVHVDVCDGNFTPNKTWNNPKEISNLKSQISNLNLEIHLMVENPEAVAESWFKSGAKGVIVHFETIRDADSVLALAEKYGAEAVLAFGPEAAVERCSFCDKFRFFQVLAVSPGFAGQKFQIESLEKIKMLKTRFPNSRVEVDGGITLETAKMCQAAGADVAVSASCLWNSPDPKETFEEFGRI